MRHFHPDWTAAEDDKVFGKVRQVENGFIGQVGCVGESFDWRNEGTRSCGDDDAPGLYPRGRGDNGVRAGKLCMFADNRAAKAFKSFLTINRRNGRDGRAHVQLHLFPIDSWRCGLDTELASLAHLGGGLGSAEQGFRRDTAGIQAITSHLAFFIQHDREPELGCTSRSRQAS